MLVQFIIWTVLAMPIVLVQWGWFPEVGPIAVPNKPDFTFIHFAKLLEVFVVIKACFRCKWNVWILQGAQGSHHAPMAAFFFEYNIWQWPHSKIIWPAPDGTVIEVSLPIQTIVVHPLHHREVFISISNGRSCPFSLRLVVKLHWGHWIHPAKHSLDPPTAMGNRQ